MENESMHSNNPLGLLDVVCGKPADVGSAHRYVHAGALFCFCSDECLARFIVDPVQFVAPDPSAASAGRPATAPRATPAWLHAATAAKVITARAPERGGPVAPPALSAAPPRIGPVGVVPHEAEGAAASRSGSDADADADAEGDAGVAAALAAESPRADLAPARRALPARGPAVALTPIPTLPTGSSNMFVSLFAWREKRFAKRTCADLLKLRKIVAARDPGLAGPALYREVVAAHNGGDTAHADAVLECAEQSFAAWPVERALRFADVVHYLAATEFLAAYPGRRWIHADMKRIVASRVPHDL